jgi:periplasmic divalent cation tolerance protein
VPENNKPVLIYSTFPSAEVAEEIGRGLVEEQLCACVNIIAGMTSIYRWEGKIAQDSEVIMIIKTRKDLVDAAIGAVRKRHPYTNPALLTLPVDGGSADYLAWLVAETTRRP